MPTFDQSITAFLCCTCLESGEGLGLPIKHSIGACMQGSSWVRNDLGRCLFAAQFCAPDLLRAIRTKPLTPTCRAISLITLKHLTTLCWLFITMSSSLGLSTFSKLDFRSRCTSLPCSPVRQGSRVQTLMEHARPISMVGQSAGAVTPNLCMLARIACLVGAYRWDPRMCVIFSSTDSNACCHEQAHAQLTHLQVSL